MPAASHFHALVPLALLTLGLQIVPVRAQENWQTKLDPGARELALSSATPTASAALTRASLGHHSRNGEVVADLLVAFAGIVPLSVLENLGLELQAVVGNIAALRAPLGSIEALAARSDVMFIEASGRSRPMGTSAGTDATTRAAAQILARELGRELGRDGRGVVLGIVDTGVDYSHPDLRDSTGSTIRFLWDMSDPDNTHAPTDVDPAFSWGREYDTDALNNATDVRHIDGDGGRGHGTHVTGVAAGQGTMDTRRRGIAPGADLIFVKALRQPDGGGDFSDGDVLAACDYIFKRAAALNQPAVINLGFGHYAGPMDGTSLFEKALSDLVGPGRILVAAAGNGARAPIHIGQNVSAATEHVAFLEPDSSSSATVTLWADPGTVEWISVGAYERTAGGLRELGTSDPVFSGQSLGLGLPVPLTLEDAVRGYLSVDALTTQDPRNGDSTIRIRLTAGGPGEIDLRDVVWSVRIKSGVPGRIDLWAQDGSCVDHPPIWDEFVSLVGDTLSTIASPATAPQLIAVGSHVSTISFTNLRGEITRLRTPYDGVDIEFGQRSYFSGQGPTRDGRHGLLVTAPGEGVFSLLSSHLTPEEGYDARWVIEGGSYHGLSGTSVAAAHVAGLVALMLEVYPTLDPALARRILEETAEADLQTGPVPNIRFGAGKLNAEAAFARLEEIATGSAEAFIDVSDFPLGVPPDWVSRQPVVIENRGTGDLRFSITGVEPVHISPSKQTTASGFVTQATWSRPMRPFDEEAAGAKAADALSGRSVPAVGEPSSARFLAGGENAMALDDGNHRADRFWGFGNGQTDLFWGNFFRLDRVSFSLERIQFFMRTESAETNQVWVAVYDRNTQQQVFAQFVTLDISPAGDWYEIVFPSPLAFAREHHIFIELAASGSILYPAGVDAHAIQVGFSHYAARGQVYKNLINETNSGVDQGAFLIRLVGSAVRPINLRPFANAVVSTFEAEVGEPITFDASHSVDPDGEVIRYRWYFDDGRIEERVTTTHAFAAPGIYTVMLEIEDSGGEGAYATGEIRILPADAAPRERLSIVPSEGTVAPENSSLVEVSFDTADLPEGTYVGALELSLNTGYLTIPVRYDVNARYVGTENRTDLPSAWDLDPAFPNPLSTTTTLRLALPEPSRVSVRLFDVLGRTIRTLMNEPRPAGYHTLHWDATDDGGRPVASGIYFLRVELESLDRSRALVQPLVVTR
jgi:subtilisin family serine protease